MKAPSYAGFAGSRTPYRPRCAAAATPARKTLASNSATACFGRSSWGTNRRRVTAAECTPPRDEGSAASARRAVRLLLAAGCNRLERCEIQVGVRRLAIEQSARFHFRAFQRFRLQRGADTHELQGLSSERLRFGVPERGRRRRIVASHDRLGGVGQRPSTSAVAGKAPD